MKNMKHSIQHFAPLPQIISALALVLVGCVLFYACFSILSQNFKLHNLISASKEEIELYCKACRILLSYLINRLQLQTSCAYSDANGGSLASTLSIKQLLLPIKALCTATNQLQRTEQFALAALMKNAKLPPHIKTTMPSMSYCLKFFRIYYLMVYISIFI